eukprot:1880462-Amphidinium_carterae.1
MPDHQWEPPRCENHPYSCKPYPEYPVGLESWKIKPIRSKCIFMSSKKVHHIHPPPHNTIKVVQQQGRAQTMLDSVTLCLQHPAMHNQAILCCYKAKAPEGLLAELDN